MKNEFIFDYLKLIKFKYSGYSKRLYLNNPNKDNLLGILQTLNALGFRANGYKLSNASDLLEVNLPAIAVLDKDFIAITSVNSNSIE